MNCKEARTQAALLIGNDVEPAAIEAVRNHLGRCVGCREHFERLASCLEVLQAPSPAWNSEEESLWPKLSARLASPNAGQKPHRLSGWAPTLAVAAACTAMFWVASSQWSADPAVGQPATFNGIRLAPQPIGSPPVVNGQSPARNGIDPRTGRPYEDPSGAESDIIPLQGPGASAIPAVPVSEPAH